MRREEAKTLQTISHVLHHLYNELNEGQQRILSHHMMELDQILDNNSEIGLLRQFKVVES